MNDAVWTAEATEKAVALWIEGRDPAEIAGAIGTTVTDVIGRVAQAALARQQAKAAETAAAAKVAAAKAAAPAAVAKVEPANAEPVRAEAPKPAPRILPSRILTADAPPVSAKMAPAKVAPTKAAAAPVSKPAAAVAKPAATPVSKPAAAVAKPAAPPVSKPAAPVAKPVVAPTAPRVEAPVMSARALEEATRAFLAANTAPPRKAAPAARPATAAKPEAPRMQAPVPRPVETPARPVVATVVEAAAPEPVMAIPLMAEPAEGGSIVALPMSRRVPAAAADGGDGVLFLKAGLLDCTFPLWADGDGTAIESKRVCGCRVLTGKRWCRTHYATVFEPPKRPMRAA
jgi:hypothetical protein